MKRKKIGENFLRVERRYGQFSRAIPLAAQCSGENLKARFKNGILTVEIPKDEKAKSKRIDRSAARDGISVRQLYNLMHKYHLDTKTFKDNPDQTSQESLFSF